MIRLYKKYGNQPMEKQDPVFADMKDVANYIRNDLDVQHRAMERLELQWMVQAGIVYTTVTGTTAKIVWIADYYKKPVEATE